MPFDLAIDIVGQFQAMNGFAPEWSFGGGTALMLQIDHRESHDIDLFCDDPQVLPFLNPDTQGWAVSRKADSYTTGGARRSSLMQIWARLIACAASTSRIASRKSIRLMCWS